MEKKKAFIPPSFEEFEDYCKQQGYGSIAQRAFNGYALSEPLPWHDSQGKPVRSWKTKLWNVWFREENRDQKDSKASKNIASGLKAIERLNMEFGDE